MATITPAPAPRAIRKSRRAQADRREETSNLILDFAEYLFAHHGRDGVTLKAIAAAAGVDTALLHYYFGDKEGVFQGVWNRRATVLNAIRSDAMDAYETATGNDLTIEGVLDVFLRPIFESIVDKGEGWANFAAIAGAANASRYAGAEMMDEYFDPIVERFIGLLRRLSPQTPDRELYWYMHLLSGALTLSLAQTGRIDTLSAGLCKSSDMMTILRKMIATFSAGFTAIDPDVARTE